jgi:hypothetical protein
MRIVIVLLASLFLMVCTHTPQPASTDAEAVAAVESFRTRLQAELKEGMARGPEHAVAVCRERAPEIAKESGSESIRLGRASERVRNPANEPEAWLVPVLRRYASHPDERTPQSVRLPDGSVGYVEPIIVQPVCLVCHGEVIAPALSQRVSELYPRDRATGYRVGDFRGVFWAISTPPER